jgi:hypothetical protein
MLITTEDIQDDYLEEHMKWSGIYYYSSPSE